MRDVFASPIFSPVSSALIAYGERIKQAELLHISAPASLEGVLALGQLEAACLDLGLKYRRRLYTPRHHLPRDARDVIQDGRPPPKSPPQRQR